MVMFAALLGTALASPSVEVATSRLLAWQPVFVDDWGNRSIENASGPVWMGGNVRAVFPLGTSVRRVYTGLDTQHWGGTWSHEPHDFVPRVHHYALETGIVRTLGKRTESRPLHWRWSYGAGPYHHRFARDGQPTLKAWGGQLSAGPGLESVGDSGWGTAIDLRFTTRIGSRSVDATVLSVGGDYDWTWHSGYTGLELRVALIAPTTRPEGRGSR